MAPVNQQSGADPHADVIQIMRADGQGFKDDAGNCKYPAYLMCPALDVNQLQLSLQCESQDNTCLTLQRQATVDAIVHKQDYHTQIIEEFAKVVNWDENQELTDKQKQLQTEFRNKYGSAAQTDNYPYFTFKSNFTGLYGAQTRYAGEPFVFTKHFQNDDLVHLSDDKYMLFWAKYFAYVTTAATADMTDTAFNQLFTQFAERVLVSRSVALCWSLLLTGLGTRPLEHDDIVPAVSQGDTLEVWKNMVIGACTCGPLVTPPVASTANYVPCGDGASKISLDACKAACLANNCYGILYDSTQQTGYYIKQKTELVSDELMQCNAQGNHNVCIKYNAYAEPSGLAFRGSGTTPETYILPPKYSYELTILAHGVARTTKNELESCFDRSENVCNVTSTTGTVLRMYARQADDTPGRCSGRCMTNPACLAWTWDKNGCKITTGIGQQTSDSIGANIVAMQKLGLDTSHSCPDGQALDLCSQTCVDVNDPMQMGWCNKHWVNCVGTSEAGTNSPRSNEKMCVGGLMPDPAQANAGTHVNNKYTRFKPMVEQRASTKLEDNCNSDGSEKSGTYVCGAQGKGRRDTTLHGLEGAFLVSADNACSTVGASYIEPAMFENWKKYLTTAANTDVKAYMTIPPAIGAYTFVTMSTFKTTGTASNAGNAYASTSGGMLGSSTIVKQILPSDCVVDGTELTCVFPSCMYGSQKIQAKSKTAFKYYAGALPSGGNCADYTTGTAIIAMKDYYNEAVGALANFFKSANNNPEAKLCVTKQQSDQNVELQRCEFSNQGLTSVLENVNQLGNPTVTTSKIDYPFFSSTSRYAGTRLFWDYGNSLGVNRIFSGMVTGYIDPTFDMTGSANISTIDGDDPSDKPRRAWDRYITCIDKQHQPLWLNGNNAGFCQFEETTDKTVVGGITSDSTFYDGNNFDEHAVVENANRVTAQFDNVRCSVSGSDSKVGYPGNGVVVEDVLESNSDASHAGNLRAIAAQAMDPDFWMLSFASQRTFSPPLVNGVTTQQLNFARGTVPLGNYRQTAFARIPWNTLSIADSQTAEYKSPGNWDVPRSFHHYALATYPWIQPPVQPKSTGSAGFMCPVGLLVASNDLSVESLPGLQPQTTSTGTWHRFAQLTLKCPASRPYRCSHLSVQQASKGTCEYGFKQESAANVPFIFSGQKPFTTTLKGLPSDSTARPDQDETDAFLSKLHRNSLCNIYDHGCFTKEEIENDEVCGHIEQDADPSTPESNMAGVLCGSAPTQQLQGGFCGGKLNTDKESQETFIQPITAQEAFEQCNTWPTAERPCPTGFLLTWSTNAANVSKPLCVPVGSAQKPAVNFDHGSPAELKRVTRTATRDQWWPGFVEKQGSFAGVGPAYIANFDQCDVPETCQGFNLCGTTTYSSGTCLSDNSVKATCCAAKTSATSSITPIVVDAQANVDKSSTANNKLSVVPSTLCAGGTHAWLDDFNRPACNVAKCEQQTSVVHAQSNLAVSAGSAAGYHGNLNELMLTFVDNESQNTINTQSCLGPQNRLQGNLWQKGTPNCACRAKEAFATVQTPLWMPAFAVEDHTTAERTCSNDPDCVAYSDEFRVYVSSTDNAVWVPGLQIEQFFFKTYSMRPATCDPTASCAYTHARDKHDQFVFQTTHMDASRLSHQQTFTVLQAQHACVAMGDQCVGIVQLQPTVHQIVSIEDILPASSAYTFADKLVDVWLQSGCTDTDAVLNYRTAGNLLFKHTDTWDHILYQSHKFCTNAAKGINEDMCCGSSGCGASLICAASALTAPPNYDRQDKIEAAWIAAGCTNTAFVLAYPIDVLFPADKTFAQIQADAYQFCTNAASNPDKEQNCCGYAGCGQHLVCKQSTLDQPDVFPFFKRVVAAESVKWHIDMSTANVAVRDHFVVTDNAEFIGLTTDAIKAVCETNSKCKGVTFNSDRVPVTAQMVTGWGYNNTGIAGGPSSVVYKLKRPTSACPASRPYAYAKYGQTGAGCCSTPDVVSSGKHGPLLDTCPTAATDAHDECPSARADAYKFAQQVSASWLATGCTNTNFVLHNSNSSPVYTESMAWQFILEDMHDKCASAQRHHAPVEAEEQCCGAKDCAEHITCSKLAFPVTDNWSTIVQSAWEKTGCTSTTALLGWANGEGFWPQSRLKPPQDMLQEMYTWCIRAQQGMVTFRNYPEDCCGTSGCPDNLLCTLQSSLTIPDSLPDVCASSAPRCPAHAECVHGQSIRVQDGVTFQCKCICDDNFTGATCSVCTRPNTENDCSTCKPNFVKGADGTCICQTGFDVTTGCTQCLHGYVGADCQIDNCTYAVDKPRHGTTLHNALVAQRGDRMLYDGIYAAGDGNIPLSMQNSFVRQDGHLWWLYSSAMDTGGTLATGRRMMHSTTAVDDSIVHRTQGEWLYSIPEYVPWQVEERPQTQQTASATLTQCEETLTLSDCLTDTRRRLAEKANVAPPSPECLREAYRITYQRFGFTQFSTYVNVDQSGDMHVCIGPQAAGPSVYTAQHADLSPMDPMDIVTDQDTWGAVCPPADMPTDDAATGLHACAKAAKLAGHRVFYYRRTDKRCCHGDKPPAAQIASEYNIDVNDCVSGGLYGTGKWRNLPNDPTLAIPKDDELLQSLPMWLQDVVVCAYNETTPFILSQFRRHAWTGTSCNDTGVVHVEFHWLYSIARGQPMSFATPRVVPHGAQVQYLQTTAVTKGKMDVDHCPTACAAQANLWYYNWDGYCVCQDTFALLQLGNAISGTAIASTEGLKWGGRKVVGPSLPLSNALFPLSCSGQRDGAIVFDPADKCGSGAANCYYACMNGQKKGGFSAVPSDPPTLHRRNNSAPFALPLASVAVPAQTPTTTRSAGSALACCRQCTGMYGAWRYAGGNCFCFVAQHETTGSLSLSSGPVDTLVSDCWAHVEGQKCDPDITMSAWQVGYHPPDVLYVLSSEKMQYQDECSAKCIQESRCRMAQFNHATSSMMCTLHAIEGAAAASNTYPLVKATPPSTVATSVKQGGCLSTPAGCFYDPDLHTPTGTVRIGTCSAQQVDAAFAANVNMYYSNSPSSELVGATLGPGCAANSNANAQFTPVRMTAALKTVDSELFKQRFSLFTGQNGAHSNLNDLLGTAFTAANDAQLLSAWPLFDDAHVRTLQWVSDAQSFSTNAAPSDDASARQPFQLSQAWAPVPHPQINIQSCVTQSAVAIGMAGIQSQSSYKSIAYDVGNALPKLQDDNLFLTLLAIEAEQRIACMDALHTVDRAAPVPVVFVVQPPTSAWTFVEYYGLPTYRNPTAFPGLLQGPFDLPTHNSWDIQLPANPSPLPTPSPAVPTPPPTASNTTQLIIGSCQVTRHHYKAIPANVKINGVENMLPLGQGLDLENKTENECMETCRDLILCRMAMYTIRSGTVSNTCALYGFTALAAACPANVTTCDHFVTTVNAGCRVTPLFVNGLLDAADSSVTIKDDCCLINLV